MEAHIDDNPTALSSKRPRVVTSPAVELALIHWVQHMEAKGETATGPMLREKRRRFEGELQVPEKERLLSEGWLQSFCKTYKICEHRQHGEAGSVDTEAAQVEREHCQKILARYSLRDRWNFNETALFPYAPPDHGLATKQMSRKKKEKFRITIGVACNADRSEKLKPFFIGKAKKPRCFRKQGPEQHGFAIAIIRRRG
ncbi:hypothetical protein PAXRUDRAFT_14622 [Paxillus rubicundulus Ve08.2h10]|uniref:HTH CENPB-type domain-containing protein n=1 Tax=Paxillus rubicundulus Ve08.2h10 TaxID=930991 RepID=A0A0D0DT09_9AGAM|nr:hypothetical protein PAXRUDRAFT_14622 [Paxillus rubicundulus Ve08.2h10]